MKYKEYLKSDTWKEKRKLAQGNMCVRCGTATNLQVHHKSYDMTLGTETEDDLMLVCENCHHELHQDAGFYDNPLSKEFCPECNLKLINNKCEQCGIIVLKNRRSGK